MATQELTLDLPAPIQEDIDMSCGAARWSVAEGGWKKLLPDLPDDVIALLATPVVVSAESLGRSTGLPEEASLETQGPVAPCAQSIQVYAFGDCTPRFLAPAPPRSRRAKHRR
jgi:hypothetical protein